MTHPNSTPRFLTLALVLVAAPTPACLNSSADGLGANGDGDSESVGVCKLGETRICQQQVDADQQGIASCVSTPAGNDWGECAVNPDMGKANCDPSYEEWNGFCCARPSMPGCADCCAGETCAGCHTPLVLSFDDRPVSYTTEAGAVTFDLSQHGATQTFDWPSARTPWLALDVDGNGAIESGAELFGSAVRLTNGQFADNGFEALAEHDLNHDGRIDAADPVWARLVAWGDTNGDRVSQPRELRPLADLGVYRLDLGYLRAPRCDERGNCEIEQATMGVLEDGEARQGRVIDVHLRVQ
ncbi:MAG: calcium-binding protein [Deltaproteobacteria bacterium]|nr:calcium-binding protein [Deltaproteobacteria bacterium]